MTKRPGNFVVVAEGGQNVDRVNAAIEKLGPEARDEFDAIDTVQGLYAFANDHESSLDDAEFGALVKYAKYMHAVIGLAPEK